MGKLIDFVEHEGENWTKLPMLPPHIEVSDLGRVRQYITLTDYKEMVPARSNGSATFCYKGETFAVHRLVAEAFVPKPNIDGRLLVKHKNGDLLDNKATNLEWIAAADNFTGGAITWGANNRQKVYCVELDQVFGSLRSASFILQLPQDVISRSIQEGTTIAGLTFRKIRANDPVLTTHNIFYLDFEKMYELAVESKSRDELEGKVIAAVGRGVSRDEARSS